MYKYVGVLVVLVLMMLAPVMAQERNPNPTNDPDVQKGYDEHQQEHQQENREKQDKQQQEEAVKKGQEQGQKDMEDYSETHTRQQNK